MNHKVQKTIYICIIALLMLGGFANAAIRDTLNFQGKVQNADGTNVADQAYDFVFKIYQGTTLRWTESWTSAALFTEIDNITFTDNGAGCGSISGIDEIVYSADPNPNEDTLTAGQRLWNLTKEESAIIYSVNTGTNTICVYDTPSDAWAITDDITNRIYVKDGIFSVELNSLCNSWTGTCASAGGVDFSSNDLWLTVNFNNDGEMKPRKRLTMVPYSQNALNVIGSGLIDLDTSTTGANAILSVTQTGDGKLVEIVASEGDALALDVTGTVAISEAALAVASKVSQDIIFQPMFWVELLTGTQGEIPTYSDTDNIPTFEFQTDSADKFPGSRGLKFTTSETLYYPTSGNIDADDGTISLWYSPDYASTEAGTKYLFHTNNHLQLLYNGTDDKFYCQAYNGADWTTASVASAAQTFSADSWHHIVCTYDNDADPNLKLYINNTETTDDDNWAAQDLPTNMYLGSDQAGDNQAKGLITDFTIFNRVLTQQEVQQIYYLKRPLQDYASQYKPTSSATVVVAASDSKNKEEADFVCDGTADDVQIQAAISDLPAAGGTVLLMEGSYTTAANLTIPANTWLKGSGKGTIITATGAAITNAVVINGNNVAVSDMKIALAAGAGGAGTRPNVVYATGRTLLWLENLWLIGDTSVANDGSDARQNGIYFTGVTDSKILDCRVEDNERHSIHITASSNYNTIAGNTCEGSLDHGIFLSSTSNHNTIDGNTCEGCGEDGIHIDGSLGNTISGNTCQGNGTAGIWLDAATDNTVAGNSLLGNYFGIYCTNSSDDNTISVNTVQGSTDNGIELDGCDGCTITGNTCEGNSLGMRITSSTNCTVTGNTIRGNLEYGIHIESASHNCTITGNTCANNDSGGNTYSGIYIVSSNQCTISGNQCDGNGLHGIYIYRSSYSTVTGNVCANQNTGDGILVTGDATTNSDYNTLTGNVCTGNGDDGIEIAGSTDANNNTVSDNQVSGNSGTAIVDGGANTQVAGNYTETAGEGLFHIGAAASTTALTVTQSGTGKALEISQTGAIGTDYGLYVTNTGAATTNVAGYFSASGATNNYGLIVESGNVGIGTTEPKVTFDVIGSGRFLGSAASGPLSVTQYGTGDLASFKAHLPGATNLAIKTSSNELSTVLIPKSSLEIRQKSSVAWTAKSAWNADDVGLAAVPAFADLDNDGDYDLLIGEFDDGTVYAYENTGSAASPAWTAKSAWNAPTIAANNTAPAFADLDNDGDYDLLIGVWSGASYAYENTGSATNPIWTAKSAWNADDVGLGAQPAFADLDNDGDYDLLIGEDGGASYAYENTGSATSPAWTAKSAWNADDIGDRVSPAFADLDNDGDYDLLIGEYQGVSYAYENTGSVTSPAWTAKFAWNANDVGLDARPAFADLDNDGDYDLLIGGSDGISYAYQNTGSVTSIFFGNLGNVGIGTTGPGYKLDIDGALRLRPISAPTAAQGVMYFDSAAGKFKCSEDGTNFVDCIGAGGAASWSDIADPTENLTLAHAAFTTTMGWTSTGALDAWTVNFNNNSTSATTQNAFIINNALVDSFTDTTTENLLLLQQLDTTVAGTTVVGNALKIDAAGSSGITNAIQITNTAGNITDGILIADTVGGTIATGIELTGTFTDYLKAPNFNIANSGNITVAGGQGIDTIAAGTLALGDITATTINIGTNATGRTINIGGTGANTIAIGNTQTGGSISLGAAMTTDTISIGGTVQTGTITLGQSTASNTINIGNATIATGNTGTINIGTSATGTGKNLVTIGTTSGASQTIVQAGTAGLTLGATSGAIGITTTTSGDITLTAAGNIALTGAAGTTYTIGATTTTGTITLGQSTKTNTINIGNANTETGLIQTINIGAGTPAGTGKALITIGNTVGATGITERVGTGNYSLDGVGASAYTIGASTTTGTITIGGTAQTGTMTLGSSSGTNTLNIAGGSGATTLNLANVQTEGSVNIGAGMTTGTITIGGTGAQTGTIGIGTGTGAQTISLGTGAGAKAVTVGSTNTTSSLTLQSGSGHIVLNPGTGNVGIGDASPGGKLTITATGNLVFGNINDNLIDDMEAITDWTASDSTNTPVALESTIVKLGSGAMKITTSAGNSNNDTVKKDMGSGSNLSTIDRIGFWIRATQTGQIISIQFSEDDTTWQDHNVTIARANAWQYEEWDISGIDSGSRDSVRYYRFIIDSDTNSPTFYIDQLRWYNKDDRAGEMFIDGSGRLILAAEQGYEMYTNITSSLPSLTVNSAVVELNQPLSVNVGGGVGIAYDLAFTNTGLTTISSEGPLKISAGDSNSYENLTLTTGGTGDVLINIASSTIGFKVLGSAGYVFQVTPEGVTTFKPAAFDTVYNFDGGTTYTDNTTEAKTSGGTAFTILAAEASSNDEFYLGLDHKFNTIYIDIATAGAGVTLSAQYYSTDWSALTITDGTSNLTVDGTITFTAPSDWATTTVNGITNYWIRLRSPATNITTAPTAYSVSPTTGNRFYAYAQAGDTAPALYINDKGNVGIGVTTPGYKLDVVSSGTTTARFGTASTDWIVVGDGAGYVKAGGIDPPYTIIGQGKYATYGLGMAGMHEETTGVVQLVGGEYIINFNELEKDSNLWLFYRITDFGENWGELTVLLSAEGPGGVWYKKEPASNRLIIYSETASSVSFRLTAPRFDWKKHLNVREDGDIAGLIVEEVINNKYTQATSSDGQATSIDSEIEGSLFEAFIQKVKKDLASLGLSIENGIAKVKELITDRITAKEIQMTDKVTGEIYCTWIENGEWMKVKGECVPIDTSGGSSSGGSGGGAAPDVCDAAHLNLCLTETDCVTAAGFWYNDTCNAEAETPACTPTDEICDGADNNCDGQIDEGGVCEPVPESTSTSTEEIISDQ